MDRSGALSEQANDRVRLLSARGPRSADVCSEPQENHGSFGVAVDQTKDYANIETDNGHDGFLLPNPHYEQLLGQWMRRVGPS